MINILGRYVLAHQEKLKRVSISNTSLRIHNYNFMTSLASAYIQIKSPAMQTLDSHNRQNLSRHPSNYQFDPNL